MTEFQVLDEAQRLVVALKILGIELTVVPIVLHVIKHLFDVVPSDLCNHNFEPPLLVLLNWVNATEVLAILREANQSISLVLQDVLLLCLQIVWVAVNEAQRDVPLVLLEDLCILRFRGPIVQVVRVYRLMRIKVRQHILKELYLIARISREYLRVEHVQRWYLVLRREALLKFLLV